MSRSHETKLGSKARHFFQKKIDQKTWELTTPHTEHFFEKYTLDIYRLIDMFLMHN